MVQSSGGPLLPGDVFVQRVRVEEGAWVRVRDQGAVSVNAAQNEPASVERQSLQVARGARLERLAEPRILQPGAQYTSRIDVDVESGGVAVFAESVLIHGDARTGRYRTELYVRKDGELVAVDHSALDVHELTAGEPAAYGLVCFIGPFEEHALTSWSHRSTDGSYAVASVLPHEVGVAVRIAAPTNLGLRRLLDECLALMPEARAGGHRRHGDLVER